MTIRGAVIRPRPFFFGPGMDYIGGMKPSSGPLRCDVAIAGGGPVGLTLALALTVVWVKDTLPWAKAETAAYKAA